MQRRVTWRTKYTFTHVPSRTLYKLYCLLHTAKLCIYTCMMRLMGYARIADKVEHIKFYSCNTRQLWHLSWRKKRRARVTTLRYLSCLHIFWSASCHLLCANAR